MDDMKRTSEYRRMLPFIAQASSDVGGDTQGEDIQALILALNSHKTSTDHDGRYSLLAHLHDDRYYTETETNDLLGYKVDKTLILTAGNGLTGGGDLSANRSFAVGQGFGITVAADEIAVNLTSNYTWTGSHTFSGSLTTGSIMPALSDVYDLGDYTKPWRKIWGSELSAVVFSQYEQVLLGGWLTISKGEGKLATAVASADTQIDLGAGTFINGDILVFRSISSNGTPQVEYMKVGTLVSSTTHNVTRNLDGTGANGWPEGTVFGNWGQIGNGRVELNAYDTPRLSVYSHGTAIANFREQVRIGDLSNNWGYATVTPAIYGVSYYGMGNYGRENYGAAFGSYEPGQANITIDPANGVRIRNYDQDVIKLNGTTASFENTIVLGAAGRLQQGTGTWGSDFTGSAIWSESSVMNIGGWNIGIKQWWGASDGMFYAGGGAIKLDTQGFHYTVNTAELVRIGGLDNWDGGAFTALKGIAVGDYSGSYMTYDQINGLIVKGQIKADTGYLKDLTVEGVLTLTSTGCLRQGTGTWGSSFTGTALWSESGVMNIGGWNAGIKQWWGGSDGAFHAGTGDVTLDSTGISIVNSPGGGTTGYLKFQSIDLSYNKIFMRSNASDAFEINNLVPGGGGLINWIKQANGTTRYYRFWTPQANVPRFDLYGNFYLGSGFTASFGLVPNPAYGLTIASPGNTSATYGIMIQNSTPTVLFHVNSVGDGWISGNFSALSITDRTPFYVGDALFEINAIKGKDGKIDHATLPAFVRVEREVIVEPAVEAKPVVKAVKATETQEAVLAQPAVEAKPAVTAIQQERDLGAMISMLTVAVQQLDEKINKLNKPQ